MRNKHCRCSQTWLKWHFTCPEATGKQRQPACTACIWSPLIVLCYIINFVTSSEYSWLSYDEYRVMVLICHFGLKRLQNWWSLNVASRFSCTDLEDLLRLCEENVIPDHVKVTVEMLWRSFKCQLNNFMRWLLRYFFVRTFCYDLLSHHGLV